MGSKQIFAPFTDEQVKGLNEYQHSDAFHEFTCGNNDHPVNKDKVLIATNSGWICPSCSYTQNWAWESMADGKIISGINDWREKHGLNK